MQPSYAAARVQWRIQGGSMGAMEPPFQTESTADY